MLENSVKNGSSPTTGVAVRAKVLYFGTCCESTLLVTKIQPLLLLLFVLVFAMYQCGCGQQTHSSCTVRLSITVHTQLSQTDNPTFWIKLFIERHSIKCSHLSEQIRNKTVPQLIIRIRLNFFINDKENGLLRTPIRSKMGEMYGENT